MRRCRKSLSGISRWRQSSWNLLLALALALAAERAASGPGHFAFAFAFAFEFDFGSADALEPAVDPSRYKEDILCL